MTQDFAKIRPEPLLEPKTVAAPPAWSLLLTGMVVGMAVYRVALGGRGGRGLYGAYYARRNVRRAGRATQHKASQGDD